MSYDHTQRGRWVEAVLFVVVVALAVAAVFVDVAGWVRIALAAAALVYYLLLDTFARLRVWVGDRQLHVAFGRGWPRKRIPLGEISEVGARRGRWWYGWGIRRMPDGWLWNVGGLDYVEVRMTSGAVFSVISTGVLRTPDGNAVQERPFLPKRPPVPPA